MEAKSARKRPKPSKRQRKRYLVVVLDSRHNFDLLKQVARKAWNIDIKVICFNEKKSKVMICVARKNLQGIKAALQDSGFKCLGVSGTIKRARLKFM